MGKRTQQCTFMEFTTIVFMALSTLGFYNSNAFKKF